MNIQREAAVRVAAMLEQVRQGGVVPDELALSNYEDEGAFNFLLPAAGWSFAEWRAVNDECAKQLRGHGFKVRLVRLALADYFDFLTRYDLSNSPENRAQFVAWVRCPEPRPDPLR